MQVLWSSRSRVGRLLLRISTAGAAHVAATTTVALRSRRESLVTAAQCTAAALALELGGLCWEILLLLVLRTAAEATAESSPVCGGHGVHRIKAGSALPGFARAPEYIAHILYCLR
jgi:hypothetical protein